MRDFTELLVDGVIDLADAVVVPLSGSLRTASDRGIPLLGARPLQIDGADVADGNDDLRALGLGVRTIAVVRAERRERSKGILGSLVAVIDGWRVLADGSKTDLSRLDLRGARLGHADLRGVDLRGADLRGADLSRATVAGSDLRGADLRGVDGDGVDLSRCDLRDADLRRTNLRNSFLRSSRMAGSSWAGADLWAAVASQHDFHAAFVSEAELQRCDLRGDTL